MVAPLLIGGIAAAVVGVSGGIWYLWRRARSGRIGLESIKIEQDEELFKLDKRIRKNEKEQRRNALLLLGYYGDLHGEKLNDSSYNLRYVGSKSEKYKLIEITLKKLKDEKMTVTQAITTFRQYQMQKNDYFADLYLTNYDREKIIPKIVEVETELYNALVSEYNDLRKEYGILKQEEEETQKEFAA